MLLLLDCSRIYLLFSLLHMLCLYCRDMILCVVCHLYGASLCTRMCFGFPTEPVGSNASVHTMYYPNYLYLVAAAKTGFDVAVWSDCFALDIF